MNVRKPPTTQKSDKISFLNEAVDNVINVIKTHEEEVQISSQKKLSLDAEIISHKKLLQQLLLEKSELDAVITTLKLQNSVYQKDHINIRNAITVVKHQIKKIKESIEKAKANELRDLEDFEKAVDEITEKFRNSTDIYDRRIVSEKIKEEKEKKSNLLERLEEVKKCYEEFLKEKGLRRREDMSEDLQSCILPDSESYSLIEMTKTLQEIMSDVELKLDIKKVEA